MGVLPERFNKNRNSRLLENRYIARMSSNVTTILAVGDVNPITLNLVTFDEAGMAETANNGIRIKVSGKYHINGCFHTEPTAINAKIGAIIIVNGGAKVSFGNRYSIVPGGVGSISEVNDCLALSIGDLVTLRASSSVVVQATTASNLGLPRLSVYRVSD